MTTQEIIQKRKFDLECIIDQETLHNMMQMLSDICYEKASHLRENWQDEKAAKLWDKNAKMLANIAPKLYS